MNNTNHLISGDNKGLASIMLENSINKNRFEEADRPIGKGSFVAAFASTNLGDVSPNTKGPHCMDTGLPCDVEHSTCNNRTQMCVASGPGKKFLFPIKKETVFIYLIMKYVRQKIKIKFHFESRRRYV